jgi:patatin-like phospholipase/acyl hydrolase
MKKILVLNGGGMKGVISAVILKEIEKRTGKFISNLFDMTAGTSTGSILTCALTVPDENGKPKYCAEDIIQLYFDEGKNIFHSSICHKLKTCFGLLGPKYPNDGLIYTLGKYFGNAQLSQALIDIIVPTYNIEQRKTFFFKSYKAKDYAHREYLIRDVTVASSSAPTFFPPYKIKEYEVFIDGGVTQNQPDIIAYLECKKMYPNEECMIVVVGTGEDFESIPYERAKNFGMIQWVLPLMDIFMQGSEQVNTYYMKYTLGKNYYKLSPELPKKFKMDDVKKETLNELYLIAENYIDRNNDLIDEICEKMNS